MCDQKVETCGCIDRVYWCSRSGGRSG